MRESFEARVRHRRKIGEADKKYPGSHKHHKRYQFAHNKHVADHNRQPDPCEIQNGQRGDNRTDDGDAPSAGARLRPEITQILDEKVADGRKCSDARQPEQPADFKTDNRSEGTASIKEWTTALAESAANLSKAQNDAAHHQRAHQECKQTVTAGVAIHLAGESENTGADNAIDRDGDKVPAIDAADQSRVWGLQHQR